MTDVTRLYPLSKAILAKAEARAQAEYQLSLEALVCEWIKKYANTSTRPSLPDEDSIIYRGF